MSLSERKKDLKRDITCMKTRIKKGYKRINGDNEAKFDKKVERMRKHLNEKMEEDEKNVKMWETMLPKMEIDYQNLLNKSDSEQNFEKSIKTEKKKKEKKEKKKDLDQLKSVLKANTKSNEHEGMNSLRARKEEIEEEENED